MAVREDGRSSEEQLNLQGGKDRKDEDADAHVRSDARAWPLQPEVRLPSKDSGKPTFVPESRLLLDSRSGPGRIIDIIGKEERSVIGIMSGTSVDGLDVVHSRIRNRGNNATARVVAFEHYPYPEEVTSKIFPLFRPETARVDEICKMNFLLGEIWAALINLFMQEHGLKPEDVDLVVCAGQTIWHDPTPSEYWIDGLRLMITTGSTFAIGESAVIAERTGILTIGDLRLRDVAAGGHGAPIVPYADKALLQHKSKARVRQNIGGIGDLAYIPPKPAGLDRVFAFDTGPGNMIIDALARKADPRLTCDENGALAAAGEVIPELLEKLLADPYFSQAPPKTTGREYFGVQYADRLCAENPEASLLDLIATATMLTAESIARAYRDFIILPGHSIQEIIVGGGGAQNPTLMAMLKGAVKRNIGEVPLLVHEDVGIPSQAKEALALAIIGDDSIYGMNTNVPGATGGRPTILGKISY